MPEILETNVKIKADASSLKKETNESIDALERLQAKYQEVSAELSRAFANHGKAEYISSLTEQRNELMHLINDIKSGAVELSQIDLGKILGDTPDTGGVETVKEKVDEVNDSLKEVKNTQDEVNHNWDTSGLNNLVKGIKKVAASIMGVTTIFSVIRKSMHQYLSQNDVLREKLNGIYYAIGSMLAPILEWIVNLFAKIVLYVNAFLKGLGFAGIQFKSITNGAKKTQKAMEKVKTIISGFDELNIFNKQATDNAEATADALADPFADVDVNEEWIAKLYEWGQKLKPVLDWIVQKVKEIWDWLWKHKELVLAIASVIAGIAIAGKIGEIISNLKVVWDVLKSVGNAIYTFFHTPLGGISLILTGLITSITAFVDMWKNGWNIIGEIIKDIGIALAAVGAVILGAPATVAAAVAGIAAVLSTLAIVIHEHWDEISAWLKAKWENLKQEAQAIWELMGILIEYAVNYVCTTVKNIWEAFSSWLEECWTTISETASSIWESLSSNLERIVKNLSNTLSRLWDTIKTNISNTWNSISSTVTNIMTSIQNFFVSSWNTIKNNVVSISQQMGNAITNIWNGVVNTIKGAINGIIGFINGMVRGIVGGINAVIGALNKFKVNIPSWVPGYGGKSFGFNIGTISAPQIPYLAKGGVITDPTLAMMGEYANAGTNPEIVTPQSLLQGMMESNNAELVSAFAQMTSQIISAINNVDMEVTIGDETIARSASRGNNSYKMMTGQPLITM